MTLPKEVIAYISATQMLINEKVKEELLMRKLEGISDSGKREQFASGAIRECREGKGRYDLISPYALMRLARWYELGAKKYEDRNWEKGLPFSTCIDSLLRHAIKYLAGWTDEDHLAAVAWNAFALMHFEEEGRTDLMDLPNKETCRTESDKF